MILGQIAVLKSTPIAFGNYQSKIALVEQILEEIARAIKSLAQQQTQGVDSHG